MKKPNTTILTVRIPRALKSAIKKQATEERRTINNFVIGLLEEWLGEFEVRRTKAVSP